MDGIYDAGWIAAHYKQNVVPETSLDDLLVDSGSLAYKGINLVSKVSDTSLPRLAGAFKLLNFMNIGVNTNEIEELGSKIRSGTPAMRALSIARFASIAISNLGSGLTTISGIIESSDFAPLPIPEPLINLFSFNTAAIGLRAYVGYTEANRLLERLNTQDDATYFLQKELDDNKDWVALAIGKRGLALVQDLDKLKDHIQQLQSKRQLQMSSAALKLAGFGITVAFPGAVVVPTAMSFMSAFLSLGATLKLKPV